MINRELLHVYGESVRICKTKFTDWTPQQTVVIATDPTVPDLPTLQATGVDQAVDLLITPPTQNVDKDTGAVFSTTNFPVVDLMNYVIYFSTSANIDSNSDGVPDSYSGSFVVPCHNKNTESVRKSFPCTVEYYFVATCEDRWGNTSVCSTEVNATPIASGYEPSVVDYGNNLEGVYEGCGIIALKLQPPKPDWEKGGGYIVYYDEKTSGGEWPSPATWTHLYHGPGPIVLHKQLEADSGSGDFRLYKYKVRVFAQGADLSHVTDDSQLSLDNTSGEVTTGTVDDNTSAGYDPSQTNNSALIAETIIAERFLGNEFVGQTFAGGIFRSTNWGTSAGSEFDASAGTLKLGGSSSPAFSVSAAGAVTCSNITITGGSLNINSGVFSVSAAGALVATSATITGTITSSAVTITGGTLNINSGVFSVSAAGAVVASSISCTNLTVGAGSTWGGNTLGTAYIPNLNCNKITSGTFGTVRIPSLSCDKITSGTFGVLRIPNLAFSKIIAGTNTASLTIGSGGYIKSANYSAGSAGFKIQGNGNAEFNDVTVRGALVAQSGSSISGTYLNNINANTITTGTLTGRVVRTAASGARIEIGNATYPNEISGYNAGGGLSLLIGPQSVQTDYGYFDYIGHTAGVCQLIDGQVTGRFSYSGAQVYSGTKSTSWANLNLSSYVGSRRALVLLRVRNNSAGARTYRFRVDGTSVEQGLYADNYPGAFSCRCGTTREYNYVWALTGTNGYVEWCADASASTTVVLLAYIN